jgi:hypothetical protein
MACEPISMRLVGHYTIDIFRLKMHKKSNLLLAFGISLLLITQTAHADFRKALDAYIARDGATMLEEVKDAADKKNDDGLNIFLSFLRLDQLAISRRTFLTEQELKKSENQSPPTMPLQKLLNKKEAQYFFNLLDEVAKRSKQETKYQFFYLAKEADANINFYSYSESGNRYFSRYNYYMAATRDQLDKAVFYLVDDISNKQIIKNEAKGLKLLKNGLAKPDAYIYLPSIASNMSLYYYNKYLQSNKAELLKEAYLWANLTLMNADSAGEIVIPEVFFQMQKDGNLKKVNFELSKLLPNKYYRTEYYNYTHEEEIDHAKSKEILQNTKAINMPKLVKSYVKNNLAEQPIFTLNQLVMENYWEKTTADSETEVVLNFSLNVFKDGRVNLALGSERSFNTASPNEETLTKLNPAQLKEFIEKVQIGFDEVPLNISKYNQYEYNCISKNTYENCIQTNLLNLYYLPITHLVTMPDKSGFRMIRYVGKRHLLPAGYYANVLNVVENYFQLSKYTCGTNQNLQYHKDCLERIEKISKIR